MSITYFYRSLKCGFSIKKVFNTVTEEIGKTELIKQLYVPSHRAGIQSVLRNIAYVFKHRNKVGINHITGDIHYCIIALIGCKSVLTIHDLSALDGAQNSIKKLFIRLVWFKIPLLFANKIVCISEHTRSQLLRLTNRKDIEVIYNAVDPSFNINLKDFKKDNPVVLQIGTAWNKNLLNTIKAITSIKCHLIIIGSVNDQVLNLLNNNDISYSIKMNLTDHELIQEYDDCDIVSFCSLYEGFGMPIIEANAVGRCVITSSVSPMQEIAGDAACLVDPKSISSIKNGFIKVISEANFRETLINNGISNIERFRVDAVSKAYINLYSKT